MRERVSSRACPEGGARRWFFARCLGAAIVCLLSLSFGAVAQAQDEAGALTTKQIEYYKKGLEAYKDGQYDRSIEYYALANAQGEFNILWLGIGRSLSKKGKCKEADEHFVKALAAKPVQAPPPAAIKAKIDEYRIDLRLQCPGTLKVTCSPESMQIRVGGGAKRACADFPIQVPAREYKLTAFAYEQTQDKKVVVKGLEEVEVSFSIDKPAGWGEKEAPTVVKPTTGPDPLLVTGYVTAGVGVAALLGAVVLDAVVLGGKISELEDEANVRGPNEQALFDEAASLQTVTLATYIGGAVLTAVGGTLIILASDSEAAPAEPSSSSSLGIFATPDAAGVQFRGDW